MTKCRSRPTIKTGTTTIASTTPSTMMIDCTAGDDAGPYYQDDAPLEPHDDEMYDDAPHARRRSGLATALALIGCAVLGTAGAYAYRSYSGVPSSTEPPPVIAADNSTPTKIVPATAGDPQSSKAMQDRLATARKNNSSPSRRSRSALVRAARAPAGSARAGTAGSAAQPSAGIRAEEGPHRHHPPGRQRRQRQACGHGAASGAAAPTATAQPQRPTGRHAPAPARRRRAPRARAPIRSTAGRRARCRCTARPRTAAIPPPAEGAASGYVVQLSSQKTESEAQSSFRGLQAKFPNELGSRQPIIRRADLGSKGVFYRTMLDHLHRPRRRASFARAYKAAGGQCVVPE